VLPANAIVNGVSWLVSGKAVAQLPARRFTLVRARARAGTGGLLLAVPDVPGGPAGNPEEPDIAGGGTVRRQDAGYFSPDTRGELSRVFRTGVIEGGR
jgi:hypothetical protein